MGVRQWPKNGANSERKIAANRNNALASTGPQSVEGKARVAQNGVTHGMFTNAALIRWGPLVEDAQALSELKHDIHADIAPVGCVEELLVDRIVAIFWRLRRVTHAESELTARSPSASPAAGPSLVVIPEWALNASDEASERSCPRPSDHLPASVKHGTTPPVPMVEQGDTVIRIETHLTRELMRTFALLDAVQRRRFSRATPEEVRFVG